MTDRVAAEHTDFFPDCIPQRLIKDRDDFRIGARAIVEMPAGQCRRSPHFISPSSEQFVSGEVVLYQFVIPRYDLSGLGCGSLQRLWNRGIIGEVTITIFALSKTGCWQEHIRWFICMRLQWTYPDARLGSPIANTGRKGVHVGECCLIFPAVVDYGVGSGARGWREQKKKKRKIFF